MGVTFALRGTSLYAHRALQNATHLIKSSDAGAVEPSVKANTDPGVFGGSVIDLMAAGSGGAILYEGRNNISRTAITLLVRVIPKYSGYPTSHTSIFSFTSGSSYHWAIEGHHLSNGQLRTLIRGYRGSLYVNLNPTYSMTSGVPIDIMVSWDGTTGANAVKMSINGVEVMTATSAFARPGNGECQASSILFGSNIAYQGVSQFELNECVLFDTAENHVYAARTDFYACDAFDGACYEDPGIANVREGTVYCFAGTDLTGTLHIPTSQDPGIENVLEDTDYVIDDENLTGTLHIPVSVDPGIGNVAAGTTYKIDDVDLEGTRDVTLNQISSGTLVGEENEATLEADVFEAVLVEDT